MKIILAIQNILIDISLLLLVTIPIVVEVFGMGYPARGVLYVISFSAVSLLMILRPLADIFDGQPWLRRLVILRKGLGILSASIIVGFMFDAIIAPNSTYLRSLFTAHFYSFDKYVFFAHIGDISGFILLITSNVWAQKLLKLNWKRVQKLSYMYFYAGGIYEAFALGSMFALYAMLVVTNLVALAWAVKVWRKTS